LLQLYITPEKATQRLAQLADETLRDEVRDRLTAFAAAEHRPGTRPDDRKRIYLTWRFADLPAAIRHRLRELGFAQDLFKQEPAPLTRSPRLVLAVTMLTMLGMTALSVAVYRWLTPPPPLLLMQEPLLNRETQVLVILPDAADAKAAVNQMVGHPGPWAVTSTDDFARLTRAIDFPGSKAVETLGQWLQVHRVQGGVKLYGGPERKTDDTDIEWLTVCPGTFTMGRIKGEDTIADKDEKNADNFKKREVTVIFS
jgi:hypothetical protein